jgi:AcrR family transcriptional regulator
MAETDSSNDDIERRVLDAASHLFVHYGYDKTTMNDIAKKAGVAKSTIYLRWKKKEDLFEALLWREGRRVTDEWLRRVEADPHGGRLGHWLRHAVTVSFENSFLTAIYKQDRDVLGRMLQRKGMDELFLQRQMLFVKLFQDLQKVGGMRKDIDVVALAYLMNAMQLGIFHFTDMLPDEYMPSMEIVWQIMTEMI